MSTIAALRDPARIRAGRRAAAFFAIAVAGLAGCTSYDRRAHYYDDRVSRGDFSTASLGGGAPYASAVDTGVAAWDGDISAPGMTAAHGSLPLGSWVRVTNTATAATATVRINRRLVPGAGRDLELSRDAAAAVGALQGGPTVVMIEPIDPRQSAAFARTAPPTYAASSYVAPAPVPAAAPAPAPVPVAAQTPGVAYDPTLATASLAPAPAAPQPVTHLSAGYTPGRYVQVGSYRNPANAYRMKARIEREGLANGVYGQAHVVTTVINGVSYHRVRLGPISTSADGQRALRQAQALGHNDARLITR